MKKFIFVFIFIALLNIIVILNVKNVALDSNIKVGYSDSKDSADLMLNNGAKKEDISIIDSNIDSNEVNNENIVTKEEKSVSTNTKTNEKTNTSTNNSKKSITKYFSATISVKPSKSNDDSNIKNEEVQEFVKEDSNITTNDKNVVEDKSVVTEKKVEQNTKKVLPKVNTNNSGVILVDKSKGNACAEAIEYFYEDAYYRYYFTCIKSQNMYVIKNGEEYKLVDALNSGIVTIQELEDNGYHFLKTAKNLVTK